MTLVIGTDEAGYGPNLGPLAVAATAWRVAAEPAAVAGPLDDAMAAARLGGGPLWGDSKQIYRGGSGLDALEAGVGAALALAGAGPPAAWRELAAALGASAAEGEAPPEQACLESLPLPRRQPRPGAVDLGQLETLLGGLGICLEAVRCRLVQPAEFNRLLDAGLNKSDILSRVTLELAAALAAGAGETVVIWCDRHGGRRRYAAQVMQGFGGAWVRPLEETATRSRYAVGERCTIEFAVGGESRLPVAVASMTAKYLRELSMESFNDFWSRKQTGLKPTAGYPTDARRWRAEAGDAIERAGIPWQAIWRRA